MHQQENAGMEVMDAGISLLGLLHPAFGGGSRHQKISASRGKCRHSLSSWGFLGTGVASWAPITTRQPVAFLMRLRRCG
jgi:hypothetical protein